MTPNETFTAFVDDTCLVSGDLHTMLLATKEHLDQGGHEPVLIFADQSGLQVDFDFRGTAEEVLARLASHPLFQQPPEPPPKRNGPGRPKLGVVSREVSLLPRHWQWLETRPGGISGTLRRLVDRARQESCASDRAREAREAVGKVMLSLAGNQPGFEEASRALYAKDGPRFRQLTAGWPEDIREYLDRLLQTAEGSEGKLEVS